MTRLTIRAFLMAILPILLTSWSGAAGQAYVKEDGTVLRLGNDYLERVITVSDGTIATARFQNKLTGRTYTLRGGEFELRLIYERVGYSFGSENPELLTSHDFRVKDHAVQEVEGGGKRVVYKLELLPQREDRPGLEVALVYEIKPGDFFTRQWLNLRTTTAGTYFIDSIAVAKNDWETGGFVLGGFGQPLFGADIFLGLEYPSSINTAEGSEVSLRSYVGEEITQEVFASQTAVIGVASEHRGAVHKAFQDYVKSIRAAQVRPRIVYNSWYDLQRLSMNRDNTLDRVKQLDQRLVKKYGVTLDSFILDDGWDDMHDLWAIDRSRFPNGFHDLADALKGINSHLGLWFGPIGGYDQRSVRIAAARRKGMEITSNGEYLCLAGRRYSRFFRDRLLGLMREYGVNHFKLDGVPFGCNEPGHGHPLGIYSREADLRAFIDILTALRRQNPNVFLNITTSIWLSPWWLRYADTVWMGGEDWGHLVTVPALTTRQSSMNYRDVVLYNDYKRHQVQFPMSSLMTQSVIKGKFLQLGGEHESLDDWNDHLVNFFGVGSQLSELYITPDLLTSQEWDSLGHTIEWAQKNAHPLLDNSTFILGDPEKRQPYGYVHDSPEKTIILIRNPYVHPAQAEVKLDEESGIDPRAGELIAELVYPFREVLPETFRYGDTLRMELGAYEQRVVELCPSAGKPVRVAGIPYSVQSSSSRSLGLHMYAPEGSTRIVDLTRTSPAKEITLDGKRVDPKASRLVVHFGELGTQESEPSFTAPSINIQPTESAGTPWVVTFTLMLPLDFTQTQLALLAEWPRAADSIKAEATDNGRAVALRTNGEKTGLWQWFVTELKPGNHRLDFRLQIPSAVPGPVRISGWLLAKRMLASRNLELRLDPGETGAVFQENLLPADSQVERKTYALFEQALQ
jgi:hypothetical protein